PRRARGHGSPRHIYTDVSPGTSESGRAARTRLGADDRLLRVSARALAAPPHHEHHRIPLRGRPAPHHGGEALQESRERDGADLENPAGGRTTLSQTE